VSLISIGSFGCKVGSQKVEQRPSHYLKSHIISDWILLGFEKRKKKLFFRRKKICSKNLSWHLFVKIFLSIYFSQVHTMTLLHYYISDIIKLWQQQCNVKFLKTSHPGGIRTRDLLFCRRTRWSLYHGARAWVGIFEKGGGAKNKFKSYWRNCAAVKQAGWPDEFVKNRLMCSQTHYLS
jgi:hypothetical protein